MQVKLKQHIMEGGRVKASVLKRKTTVFVKDAVVDVGDGTGKKWIERGWAEEVKPQPAAEAKATQPKPVLDDMPGETNSTRRKR